MPLDLETGSAKHGRRTDVSPVWVADAIPLPIRIEERGSERPVSVLVTDGHSVLHQDLLGRLAGEPETVAEALAAAVREAAAQVGRQPEVLLVRHPEVARALSAVLRDMGSEVRVDPTPPGLEDVARSLLGAVGGLPLWPPIGRCETWRGWDLPKDLLDALFDAAADFYEQAPWQHVANLQAPRATLPSGREWSACVLGAGGEAYGLALYTTEVDLLESMTCDASEEVFQGMRGRMVSIGYEPVGSIPRAARKELAVAGWKVAGPRAYPDLMTSNTPAGGVSRADARDLITLLRAVPRFAAAHAAALHDEERTGIPCEPIEWADVESGSVLRYDGGWTGYLWEDDPVDEGEGPRLMVAAALEHAERELGPEASPDEIMARANELLAVRMDAYNASAQADLGGLSPGQVQRLLASDWGDTGAVRLHRGLEAGELGGSWLMRRVLALLEAANEQGGLGRTEAGYLKPAVVRALVDKIGPNDPLTSHWVDREEKRTRESDVWPVHEARILADLAGLLRPRKTRFELTREGRRLLDAECAGELFALLFETCFRRFNVFYGGFVEWPELQKQIAFTLCRLPEVTAEWRYYHELAEEAVLPYAIHEAPDVPVSPDGMLASYVLDRLDDFGLMEWRVRDAEGPAEYRVTPLFGRFLSFEVGR